jgi:hypothetical protein
MITKMFLKAKKRVCSLKLHTHKNTHKNYHEVISSYVKSYESELPESDLP